MKARRRTNWVKGIICRIVTAIVVYLLVAALDYFALPAKSLNSEGFWWFVFALSAIGLVGFGIVEDLLDDGMRVPTIVCGCLGVIFLLTLGIISLINCEMFHAYDYRSRVIIEEGDFATEVISANDELSIVDVVTARKLGDRTIAQVENSMWYDVSDEYNLICYKGEYYRISPLNYGGLAKYWRAANSTGIPGYVMVNAKTQEATFVELDEHYYLSPSGYFGNNLTRHLRNQYPALVFGTSFFEIDDEGHPYWITAVKDHTLGLWSCKVEKRFVITDATSGESVLYETEGLPGWVDHAFDLEYLMDVTTDNFKYVKGFWNAQFSKTGVQKLSYNYKDDSFAGYNSTITANGEVVFFTGVTPANRSESIYGFVQLSPRTGKVKFYACTGAEESSAQIAAEGLITNFNYSANYPSVVNVEGIPTYFMALKDVGGLVQRYALVNIQNYAIAVEDTTIEGAISKYLAKMNREDIVPEVAQFKTQPKTGVISNIFEAQIDGYTYYYFILEGEDGIYVSSITNGHRQVTLQSGTEVTIEYYPAEETSVFMVTNIQF